MKTLFRPTLARRLMLVLLAAFGLVWLVLLAFEYLSFKRQMHSRSGLAQISEGVTAGLETALNAEQASVIVHATSVWLNQARRRAAVLPGDLLFQLRSPDGATVYSSPALGTHALDGGAQLGEKKIGAHVFWLYCSKGQRWILCMAEPKIAESVLLARLGMSLLPYLAISLPLVLLPLWLGIIHGLRPVRRLRDAIAARPPNDLSAINVNVEHAELQPLVTAFDDLVSKLRHKVDRERAFIQDAAHELRTPMAVIVAQAHVMSRAEESATRHQAKADLDLAVTRASHLTEQLLALAAMDEVPLAQPLVADLAALLRQQLAQLAPRALARRVDLSLEAPQSLPHAVDVAAFLSVASNLASNAISYVHEGGRVVVQLAIEGDVLVLTVLDNGPGIAVQDQERIFDRFYRGGDQAMPGSGLGLSIVRQAAARLHGSVALGPGLDGAGCRFALRIDNPRR